MYNGATYQLATGGVTFTNATQVNDNGTMRDITVTDGTATFVGGDVTGTTYFVVNSDITAGAAGTEGAQGYDVAGGRTLTVNADSGALGTLNLQSGSTFSISGASQTFSASQIAYNVKIGNEGEVTVSGYSGYGDAYIRGAVDVLAGGKLILNGEDSLGWSDSAYVTAITLLGEKDNLATVSVKGRQTMVTDINLQGYASITNDGEGALELLGGSITASGTNNTIATNLNTRDAGTITVAANGELTFTGNLTYRQSSYNGAITKEGTGKLIFDGASNALIGTLSATAGTVEFTNGLSLSSSGALSMADGTTLILGSAIENTGSGSVSLGGDLVINNSSTNYELYAAADGGTYSDVDNGFFTSTGSKYYLVKGGTVDISGLGSALLDGTTATTIETLTDGGAVFTAGAATTAEYYVNTTVSSDAHATAVYKLNADTAVLNVVGTLSNSRIIQGEGQVNINAGQTLVLDTADSGLATLFTSATGAGNIELSTALSLVAPQQTQVSGKLTIKGVQLNLGSSDLQNATDNTGASIASFNNVELDNGTIRIQNPNATINNLTVTAAGGTIDVENMGNADGDLLSLAETTNLLGNLTYKNTWNSQVNIEKLTGTGNLIIDGSKRNDNNTSTFTIAAAENYSGTVQVVNKAGSMTLDIVENLGLNVHFSTREGNVDLTGIGAKNNVTLQGVLGSMTAGDIAANVEILNSTGGEYAGLEVNGGANGNTYNFNGAITGGGNVVINKNIEDGQMAFNFKGDTSGWTGQMEVIAGTHDVTYSGTTAIKNSNIQTREDAGATMNLTIANSGKTVTVSSNIKQVAGTMNLKVTEGTTANFNGSVSVTTLEALGNLSFTAQDALNVTNLTGGNVGTLTIKDGAGSVSASGSATLTGGATINASLTLGNGATLEMDELVTDAVTVNGVLTFGGQLTMGDKLQAIVLEMAAWPTPELVLFDGLTSFTFGETLVTAGAEVQASEYFSDISDDTLYVTYRQVDNVGSLVMFSIVPEPATTTLSLLALAGLAARRRRR